MVKSRPNMNKMALNSEMCDGVSVLLVIYWLKEKPNNWGLSNRLDIIATKIISYLHKTAQFLTKSKFFWHFVENF